MGGILPKTGAGGTADWIAAQLADDMAVPPDGRARLRIWSSADWCIVLGRSCRIEEDVNVESCSAGGIPILRRQSGGGTVLLGPGCVNFGLALPLERWPELENVAASYTVLLGAIAGALGIAGLRVEGSDLLLDGRKVSGNAQRRTRNWVLHHGTLLCGMDLEFVGKYLREPRRRPRHRGNRTHLQFLANLPLSEDQVRKQLTTIQFHSTSDVRQLRIDKR